MRILPVIDYQAGRVVRAVGGRRSEYTPLTSRLTNSTTPVDVARAIRDRFGFTEIYLADLDAISGGKRSTAIYRDLRADGFQLWLDAGIRTAEDARELAAHCDVPVIGLETLRHPDELHSIAAEHAGAFSLDLLAGRPLCAAAHWPIDPLAIAEIAIESGFKRIIVLDLAQVGSQSGPGTEAICATLAGRISVYAGGGIRNRDDVRRFESLGAAGVLVSTALHEGIDLL